MNDVSGSQPASKRIRTSSSTPTFRVARAPVNRTSRLTTIRKSARGRRGYQTQPRHPSANEDLSDEAVSEPPPPDLGELNCDPETLPESFVPFRPPKQKRERQNNTSVRAFILLVVNC
jgi:hypothetical protein